MAKIDQLKLMLNAETAKERLDAVRELKALIEQGEVPAVPRKDECNNHVHSFFSFSPYSPSMIAWKAYESGLETCGIVDHESVAGCREFAQACQILGIVPTLGFELRMHCDETPIPTYIYLGDIRGESTTGDRKAQKFEDDILDELFECFYQYGLRAISYVPSRNDEDQVVRIRELCQKYGMFEICGEDINQPRQDFICKQKCEEDRLFFNDSTWALVGHEKLANKDLTKSIISQETIAKMPDLKERMLYYKNIALNH